MATRRAAASSSNTRTRSGMRPPAPVLRSKNTLARPEAAENIDPESHTPSIPPTPSPLPETFSVPNFARHADGKDAGTNIQVVIRCRVRSDREIQENSPIIVKTNGARGEEITIETAMPNPNLGGISLPPTRTYPFDRVFGPEADQAMIYHDVVSPILDEVLMGYNCTVFAYGQTGTGKTFTMQGDLTPSISGGTSTDAGIIPRTLARLFYHLENKVADYSVKISYMELYNEELRDLLAAELKEPTGNAQPMGQGSNAGNGLKIYDDAGKKGVMIQGLEEVPVKDAKDAIELLRKGSHRRQIAATKFNEHSSRSHSIFTITVHTKESSSKGDDLLKVGKLNLVDLAGSENIGRSGAENKRAREAGMINQSLLTLGRVINGLVDNASHIPYRESKLTRLLQDSLGGRTKTCIIATVSPTRSNMEESLSTLDYALRAKSIKNKPELNQRMTRNGLLKEYVCEIERLKGDLAAAREKNGVFFTREHWNEISEEHEIVRTKHEEARRQVEIIEIKMRAVREEFEQSIALLLKRENELNQTKEQLREKEELLGQTEEELRITQVGLEEEIVVRKAHAETERELDGVAGSLKTAVKGSVKDVQGLFDKLARKTSVFSSNLDAVSQQGSTIFDQAQELVAQLERFDEQHGEVLESLQSQVEKFHASESQLLSAQATLVEEELYKFFESIQKIHDEENAAAEVSDSLMVAISEASKSLKQSMATWEESLKEKCSSLVSELTAVWSREFSTATNALKGVADLVEKTVAQAQEHIDTEKAAISQAKASAELASSTQIARLQEQNELLTRLLDSEKSKSERVRDDLISQISTLLVNFTDGRDRSMRDAVGQIRTGIAESQRECEKFKEEHGELMDGVIENGEAMWECLEGYREDGAEMGKLGAEALSTLDTSVKTGFSKVLSDVSTSTSKFAVGITQQVERSDASNSIAFETIGRHKRARIEIVEALETDAQESSERIQEGLASTTRNVEEHVKQLRSDVTSLTNITESYRDISHTSIPAIAQAANRLLEDGTREDTPTGQTPRKRAFEYVDSWELTKPRDVVLQLWRDGGDHGKPVTSSSEWNIPTEETHEEPRRYLPSPTPSSESVLAPPSDIILPSPPPEMSAHVQQIPPPTTRLTRHARSNSAVSNISKGKRAEVDGARGALIEQSANVVTRRRGR
ncbi:hypothetical protein BOTBODRAFT_191177 [Botryobasidium botryosum FD-172 SS1]|uniref:Kinesin motor domain-containing protein n=1 Tax=Botryobasidium botryosum (strain FD-172 SS1) TaxID=930990 RepID=A0A067MBN9_BOTB1|nr:hypothetical protein BOTBODRAFT_191177 [Botryobasidium botryosum FD-172 SS1]